nr:MAG: terminase large subunit [Caudoviricetes sp.]
MWTPQRGPQLAAIEADWCDELFYGGARGGGKSDFQLGFQEDGARRYAEGWRGIMFRKTYPELEELQGRAMEVFSEEGAIFKSQPSERYPYSSCWYWPNGATVKMRYIEREQDYGRYHGHQYTGISFDEVTEYATPTGLLKMLSTLRSAKGVPCSVRLTGNPGGVGHIWVKARYIDPVAPYTPYTDPDTGFTRIFIPSKLSDNPALMRNDPKYLGRVLASTAGNEALRQAWIEGKWDIVAGAFFESISRDKHALRPFVIPEHWLKFRSMDWGSARPFSVGWWTVASEACEIQGRTIPRGAMIRYREWYGAKEPNVGLKLTAAQVAEGIKAREVAGEVNYGTADPSMWKVDGGPSIAERMAGLGVYWMPADNSRQSGWAQVRDRILGEDDAPMMFVVDSCVDWWRTMPLMQHDKTKVEDIDTDMEDHVADEVRYACMSRPWIPARKLENDPAKQFGAMPKVSDLMTPSRSISW